MGLGEALDFELSFKQTQLLTYIPNAGLLCEERMILLVNPGVTQESAGSRGLLKKLREQCWRLGFWGIMGISLTTFRWMERGVGERERPLVWGSSKVWGHLPRTGRNGGVRNPRFGEKMFNFVYMEFGDESRQCTWGFGDEGGRCPWGFGDEGCWCSLRLLNTKRVLNAWD